MDRSGRLEHPSYGEVGGESVCVKESRGRNPSLSSACVPPTLCSWLVRFKSEAAGWCGELQPAPSNNSGRSQSATVGVSLRTRAGRDGWTRNIHSPCPSQTEGRAPDSGGRLERSDWLGSPLNGGLDKVLGANIPPLCRRTHDTLQIYQQRAVCVECPMPPPPFYLC